MGVPHPDYLLGRDSLANFEARGFTPEQWDGWITYARYIPLPQDRIDMALAGVRSDLYRSHGGKARAEHFMPRYGQPSQKLSEAELKAKAAQWVAMSKAMENRGK